MTDTTSEAHEARSNVLSEEVLDAIEKAKESGGSSLSLNKCGLKSEDLPFLVQVLQEKLPDLTTLQLISNEIVDVEPLATLVNLKHLDLTSNMSLKDVSPLKKLRKLETLDLMLTSVPGRHTEGIIGNIEIFHFLRSSSEAKEAKKLPRDVVDRLPDQDFQKVTSLNLRSLGLTSQDLPALVEELKKYTNLKKLDLNRNQLTNVGPLADLKSLEELVLIGNEKLNDIRPLSSLKSLQYLDLGKCAVGPEDLADSDKALRNVWPHLSQVQNFIKSETKRLNALEGIKEKPNPVVREVTKFLNFLNPKTETLKEMQARFAEETELTDKLLEDFRSLVVKLKDRHVLGKEPMTDEESETIAANVRLISQAKHFFDRIDVSDVFSRRIQNLETNAYDLIQKSLDIENAEDYTTLVDAAEDKLNDSINDMCNFRQICQNTEFVDAFLKNQSPENETKQEMQARFDEETILTNKLLEDFQCLVMKLKDRQASGKQPMTREESETIEAHLKLISKAEPLFYRADRVDAAQPFLRRVQNLKTNADTLFRRSLDVAMEPNFSTTLFDSAKEAFTHSIKDMQNFRQTSQSKALVHVQVQESLQR